MADGTVPLRVGDIVRLKPGSAWRLVLGQAADDYGVVEGTFAVNGKAFVSVRLPQQKMSGSMMPADVWIKRRSPVAGPSARGGRIEEP